jgi:hypothetical protein
MSRIQSLASFLNIPESSIIEDLNEDGDRVTDVLKTPKYGKWLVLSKDEIENYMYGKYFIFGIDEIF